MITKPPRVTRARARRRARPLEQLAFELGPERPRWVFSRLAARSPHFKRIKERIEFVRYFFPELDGVTIRVGLAQKPGILGWGSLDPERPGIWIRPRRVEYFTIAHELTHLLQARNVVPRGERACDLWALARSPLVVDVAPGYLRLPRALRGMKVAPDTAAQLCEAARRAIAARAAGDRRYLKRFETEVTAAFAAPRAGGTAHASAPVRAARRSAAGAGASGRDGIVGGTRVRRAKDSPPPRGFFERVHRLLTGSGS